MITVGIAYMLISRTDVSVYQAQRYDRSTQFVPPDR
jgi:CIC family chloride channel protein